MTCCDTGRAPAAGAKPAAGARGRGLRPACRKRVELGTHGGLSPVARATEKGARRMPRLTEAKKGVASCEKPRVGASRR